jgi:hypothetical protein
MLRSAQRLSLLSKLGKNLTLIITRRRMTSGNASKYQIGLAGFLGRGMRLPNLHCIKR